MKRVSPKVLVPAALLCGMAAGYAFAAQPYMESALGSLRAAQGSLQAALADKGGHRVAAMRLVEQAITKVQLGMEVSGNQ